MAWEWVGPVCTAAAGLGGITATYLTGRESRATAERQAKEQRQATVDATLRADRLKTYTALISSFWDATARCNTALLMGIGRVQAAEEEKAKAVAEAQEAQAIFMTNAHAVSVLGGTGVVGALSGAEQFVTHRFTSALAAVRGEKDALRRYLHAPVSFKLADLHAAMKAELGVPVDTADIGNLIRRSEAAEDVGTSSRE